MGNIDVVRDSNPPPSIAKALDVQPITTTSCKEHSHMHERFTVGSQELCLGCTADIVEEKTGKRQPWFFTGSPFGQTILSLIKQNDNN